MVAVGLAETGLPEWYTLKFFYFSGRYPVCCSFECLSPSIILIAFFLLVPTGMHNWFQEIKSWVEAFVSRVHGTLVSKFVSVCTIATMYLALLSKHWLSIKGEQDWKANDHWVAILVFWGDTNHSVLGAEMLFRLDDLSFKPCQMIFLVSNIALLGHTSLVGSDRHLLDYDL